MLELIFKGLFQWLYALFVEITEYAANGLLDVFSMDMAYFENALPVTSTLAGIIIASGWALLLGNLVFQAAKSMMSGLGFEADDPRELFMRTFVFGFLLLASRQICEIGLGLSGKIIALLQIPSALSVRLPDENIFAIGASWLLVIIIGLVLIWQIIRLFLDIGERYFLVGLLTLLAPWAFAMGGSRSTADIFKGWARMFATMCVMMALNVVILKILISAMGFMPSGAECVPWIILVTAISRTGRKLDSIIMRIGLNPATVGSGGRGFPGMLSYMVMRSVASNVMSSFGGGARTTNNARSSSTSRNGGVFSGAAKSVNGGSRGNPASRPATANAAKNTSGGSAETSGSTYSSQREMRGVDVSGADVSGSAVTSTHTPQSRTQTSTQNNSPRRADSPSRQTNVTASGAHPGIAGNPPLDGAASAQNIIARSSHSNATTINQRPGIAGTPSASGVKPTANPPAAVGGTAGKAPNAAQTSGERTSPRPARYTTVQAHLQRPGSAGIGGAARIQPGGTSAKTTNQQSATGMSSERRDISGVAGNPTIAAKPSSSNAAQTSGNAGKESRRSDMPAAPKPPMPSAPTSPKKPSNAGSGLPSSPTHPQITRQRGNEAPPARQSRNSAEIPRPAAQETAAAAPPKNAPPYKPRQSNIGKGAIQIGALNMPRGSAVKSKKRRRKGDKK